jgi:hypothetical protein
VRRLISGRPSIGFSFENAERMLITRAVTVRGVPFLRLPDTMALLHPYVIRREPVRQQCLAQRGAMDRQPGSVGERVAGHFQRDTVNARRNRSSATSGSPDAQPSSPTTPS